MAARQESEWSRLYQGIVLFNEANTDAPDMSPSTELILTYAAMEQMLGITSGKERRRLPEKFAEVWHPRRGIPPGEWRPPRSDKKWKKDSLRACWALDLYVCRGNLAHGHEAGKLPSEWNVSEHLLLTSFVVPLLVKRILSKVDLYEPTDDDERDFNALESLLNLPNVFAEVDLQDSEDEFLGEPFEWRRVLRQEADRQLRQFIMDRV